jgi:hypothetical protein
MHLVSDNTRAHEVLETCCQFVLCRGGSSYRIANAKRNAMEYREIRNLTAHKNIQHENIIMLETYTGIVLIVYNHIYYYFRQ